VWAAASLHWTDAKNQTRPAAGHRGWIEGVAGGAGRGLAARPPATLLAHKLRNIADKVPKKKGPCGREAAAMYQASSRQAAQGIFQRWARKWRPLRPRAVACVERDLEELLTFYAFPAAHWRKIRTTNIIERAFREVRRRTRPMSSFTNPASCDRIVFGVISHLNRSWEKEPLKEFTQIA
jgi:putative transposase